MIEQNEAYTAEEFRAWRLRMGWTHEQAASVLGIARDLIWRMEASRIPVRRVTTLACYALEDMMED